MLDLLNSLRQLRYPREFRIEPSVWSPQMLRALQELVSAAPTARASASAVDETAHALLLADIATNLWRLRQKMLQPGTDLPLEEMRRAYRPFEAAWNSLLGAGIEVLDHTGNPFHSGLLLHVLAFEPTPGIVQETVIETVRPTVYYKQQLVQSGEVIVGVSELTNHSVESTGGESSTPGPDFLSPI